MIVYCLSDPSTKCLLKTKYQSVQSTHLRIIGSGCNPFVGRYCSWLGLCHKVKIECKYLIHINLQWIDQMCSIIKTVSTDLHSADAIRISSAGFDMFILYTCIHVRIL